MATTVDELLAAADALSLEERAEFVQRLTAATPPSQRKGRSRGHSIFELKGVGAEIWRAMDVDAYIRSERDSWNSERT